MTSYHDELEALATSIGSDGCTHALQVRVECCWEHDWAYVTGTTPRGEPLTKAQADQRFRDCLCAHSPLRWLSPWAWVRWLAVSRFGHGNWTKPRVMQTQSAMGTATILATAKAARAAILEEGHAHLR